MKQKHEEIFKSVMHELGIDECHRKLEHLGVDKSNMESLEGVQQMEINVVDESMHRVKVMLDLENKWESLRVRKEAEHTTVMKQEITEEQDKLVKELQKNHQRIARMNKNRSAAHRNQNRMRWLAKQKHQ